MRLSNKAAWLLLTAFTASSVHASVVYRKDHWFIDDMATSTNPNGPCVMATQSTQNRVVYRLEIVRPKNADGPTEVQIRMTGRGATGMTGALSATRAVAFSQLSVEGNNSILWALPQGTSEIINYFAAGRELRMRPADGSRDQGVNFEDGGFNNVKTEFARRCLGNRELVDSGFESSFLSRNYRPINPMGMNTTSVVELRSLLGQGFIAYKNVNGNRAEISALRNRFSAQLNEAERLEGSISTLSEQIAAGREDHNRSEVSRLTSLIQQQTNAVAAATAARDRAENAVAPLRAEHDSHASAANGARNSANGAQQDISELNRAIGQAETQIIQLEADRENALRAARDARRDMRGAERDQNIAERAANSFDVEREYRQRVAGNPRWREAREALPTAQRLENEHERLRDAAHADKEAKEDIKKACQRVAGQDCTAQVAAHAEALALYRRLEAEEDRLQSRRAGFESTINLIESSARNEVNSIMAELRGNLIAANNEIARLNSVIVNGEGTAQRIAYQTIPGLNEEISRLERALPRAEGELRRSLPEADRLEGILAAYEARVGWATKTQNLDRAQADLNQKTGQLNSSNVALNTANRTLENVQNLKNQLSTAQARLVVVNAELVPFNDENLRLQGIAANLSGVFQDLSAQFESKIP